MIGPDVVRDAGDSIVFLLRGGVPAAMVDPTRILLATPDEFATLATPPNPHITVFLYRIAVNGEMRNVPPRLLAGGRIEGRALPLDLFFLVTAWASDTRDELRILGRVLQVLHEAPVLGPSDLVGASWESDDAIQVVFDSLPLDDHYRIWDSTKVPYRLSLTYVARVIRIVPVTTIAPPPVVEAFIGTAP